MRFREFRKQYLIGQALSYVAAGLFLIRYASAVQAREFIFAVGMTLCAISVIDLFVVIFLSKYIRIIERIDSYAKIPIVPITFVSILLSILNTRDMESLEISLLIFILLSLLLVLWIGVSGFRVMSKYIRGSTDTRGSFYKLFVYLSGLSLATGLFLMVYGAYDPESTRLMISFNKWLYDPMVWFAVPVVCVFPILALTPNSGDEDDESKL
jgi:hypothetical protein